MDAVITAGGRIEGEFAAKSGVTVKALAEVAGRPVICTVVDALREVEQVERIFVIGPEELLAPVLGDRVDEIIPESASGAENFIKGIERCAADGAETALFAASDLPFLTADAVRAFLRSCPDDGDFCYPVLSKEQWLAAYPGSSATFAPLRDAWYAGGCVFRLNPNAILANRSMIDRVFTSRKSLFKLARILGISFIIRLLTRTADVEICAQRGSQILGCNCGVVTNCPPELAYDLDDLADYEYALAHAARVNA